MSGIGPLHFKTLVRQRAAQIDDAAAIATREKTIQGLGGKNFAKHILDRTASLTNVFLSQYPFLNISLVGFVGFDSSTEDKTAATQ